MKHVVSKSSNKQKKSTKSLLTSLTYFTFTDDDTDLVSNDFKLEKNQSGQNKQPLKKKKLNSKNTEDKKVENQKVENQKVENQKDDTSYEIEYKHQELTQKNTAIRERLITVDLILEIYPNLKKDKKKIVDNVLGKKETPKKSYIIEMLNLPNKKLYKDTFGNIINENADLVGFWIDDIHNSSCITVLFFDDIKNIKIKLCKNKKKLLD